MKKALEAGISKREWFAGMAMLALNSRYQRLDDKVGIATQNMCEQCVDIADAILAALDEEPDKPEPQGSVDWDELYRLLNDNSIMKMNDERSKLLLDELKENQSQWLKTKPAIDPEIKRVYEKYKDYIEGRKGYDGTASKGIVEISNAIKAHCEKGGK